MIPTIRMVHRQALALAARCARLMASAAAVMAFVATAATAIAVAAASAAEAPVTLSLPKDSSPLDAPIINPAGCLSSGDGYLRAHLAGAIDATIDWPNSGTRCQGEWRGKPPGVRLSFERTAGGNPNLLLVFGLTGVRAGKPGHAIRTNVTVVVQGKSRIFGTLGDKRCTVDSLTQRPLSPEGFFRVEARGFCTSPAHAVHGDGDVLVSTFEFAGVVNFQEQPP